MELKYLSVLLNNIQNSDKQIREGSEYQLLKYKTENIADLLKNLIGLIKIEEDEKIKTLSIILLRQYLIESWSAIEVYSKELIKNQLLELVAEIDSWSSLKKLSDVIADLAVNIIKSQECETWGNLLDYIFFSLNGANTYLQVSSLKILSGLFPYLADYFSSYNEIFFRSFSTTLESPEIELRKVSVHAFSVLISVISGPEAMYYIELIKPLLKAVLSLIPVPGYLEDALKDLRDLAETEPYYFNSRLAWCFDFGNVLCNQSVAVGCKYLCVEYLVLLIETHKAKISRDKAVIVGICELIKKVLKEVIGQLDDIEINYEQLILNLLGKVIKAIGETVIEYLLKISESVLGVESDWESHYISIMYLIKLIPEIYYTDKMKFVLSILHTYILSTNFKLRWACCKLIAELCNEYPKNFQKNFHISIIPILVQGICDTNCVVVSKACCTCKLFIEDCDRLIVKKCAPDFIPAIITHLSKKDTVQASLKVLEAFILICKEDIKVLFDHILIALGKIFERYESLDTKKLGLDCLLALRKTIKKNEFIKYTPYYTSIIRSLQTQTSSQDFTINYILNAWKILSKYLKSDFTPYLSEIVPWVLCLISNNPEENLEEYLETILSIIDSTKGGYLQYLQKTSDLILPLITINTSEIARSLVCSVCSSLVNVIRDSGNKEYNSKIEFYCRTYLNAIWKKCSEENDLNTLVCMLSSLKVLIEAPGYEFLSTVEVNYMIEIILKLFEDQAGRKSSDNDQRYLQEDLKQTISDILATLFKSHKGPSKEILEYVYAHAVGKFLNQNNVD